MVLGISIQSLVFRNPTLCKHHTACGVSSKSKHMAMSTMQVANVIWWNDCERWGRVAPGLRGHAHALTLSPRSDCSQALVCWRCFGEHLAIVRFFCDSAAGGRVSSCLHFYAPLGLTLCHLMSVSLTPGTMEAHGGTLRGHPPYWRGVRGDRTLWEQEGYWDQSPVPTPPSSSPFRCVPPNQ